jgi:uncharacterized CHY-type Zn-finger protein
MTADARPIVRGIEIDAASRCLHYHSALDIVAIRMHCCGEFYACAECHQALADHPIGRWPASEWDQAALRCGACGTEISIHAYFASRDRCPACAAPFNPGCRNHYDRYFVIPGTLEPLAPELS